MTSSMNNTTTARKCDLDVLVDPIKPPPQGSALSKWRRVWPEWSLQHKRRAIAGGIFARNAGFTVAMRS